MINKELQAPLVASLAVAFFIAPSSARAAAGRTYEELLMIFLALCAFGLLIWAVYYFTMHGHFIRRDRQYKRVVLPVIGVVAVGFGLTSVVTGEVSLVSGSSVLRALDPQLFWRYVALEFGSGFLLIMMGLLYRSKRF